MRRNWVLFKRVSNCILIMKWLSLCNELGDWLVQGSTVGQCRGEEMGDLAWEAQAPFVQVLGQPILKRLSWWRKVSGGRKVLRQCSSPTTPLSNPPRFFSPFFLCFSFLSGVVQVFCATCLSVDAIYTLQYLLEEINWRKKKKVSEMNSYRQRQHLLIFMLMSFCVIFVNIEATSLIFGVGLSVIILL